MDSQQHYERACDLDRHGREAEALPHYEAALGDPDLADRAGALLGYGSTLRVLGRYDDAASVLRAAVEEFPRDVALRPFLALAEHNVGNHDAVLALLMSLVLDHTDNADLLAVAEPLRAYAAEPHRVWR